MISILIQTQLDSSIPNLKDLIINLRHSFAHFDIEVIFACQHNLVDYVEFMGSRNQSAVIARFSAPEIYPFLVFQHLYRIRTQLNS